ncbi:MAG TPA: hypothetical protein VFQ32_13110, partial [Ktedonobacterales bacterium]|nr:hypothetical protein [Ktedonobacterales bacterium]
GCVVFRRPLRICRERGILIVLNGIDVLDEFCSAPFIAKQKPGCSYSSSGRRLRLPVCNH